MSTERFGELPDGSRIDEIAIGNDRISAKILTYGAIQRDLSVRLGGAFRPTVLGFDTLAAYLAQHGYLGVIAGRYANRIRAGAFTLDGKSYRLSRNERGKTHLHGGEVGFSRKVWTVSGQSSDSVHLTLESPGGEEGYPGRVAASCTYRIIEPAGLAIELTATSEAPTVINLTGHAYFNLDGSSDIRDHRLMIAADEYLPVDGDLIPLNPAPVAGTAYDFRKPRPIRWLGGKQSYDNNFIIASPRSSTPRLMARLASGTGDVTLDLLGTEAGLQFYDGGGLDVRAAGLQDKAYGAYGGLCLEPQCFPDTPNRPDFPSCVLRPGETYTHKIEYRFGPS